MKNLVKESLFESTGSFQQQLQKKLDELMYANMTLAEGIEQLKDWINEYNEKLYYTVNPD